MMPGHFMPDLLSVQRIKFLTNRLLRDNRVKATPELFARSVMRLVGCKP